MTVDDLRHVLPPPLTPLEASGASWQNIEDELKASLPQDYKSFVELYGSGRIGGFLWILNPFSKRENLNLLTQIARQLATLRELVGDFGETCPYPLYPVEGGLLPFGITDNGDVLYWQTVGASRDWNIVVNESRSAHYEVYEFDMTTFLSRVLSGELRCPIFPNAFPPAVPSFETM